jgi:glycosyltransferase involved in cell wall biosynthesis
MGGGVVAGGLLIGIDGRCLAGAMAGSGRYVSELCKILDTELPEARFAVFSNVEIVLPVQNGRWSVRVDNSFWGKWLSPFVWYMLRAGRLAGKDGVHVFWGGSNFLPLWLAGKVHAVVTVLDLVHRVFPQSMGWKHRLAFEWFFRLSLKRANVVAAISNGTSSRLALYGYRAADIIVRPGVDARFGPVDTGAITAMRAALGIGGRYLLSVSTLEPRKNLGRLIAAYLNLHSAGEIDGVELVLVGQMGWKTGTLMQSISEALEAGAKITLTGHVPDEMLSALYAGAEIFLMPSIYEGFGLPILEARMCGARVVATDMPETREAGGVSVTYIAPTQAGIEDGIRRTLNSKMTHYSHPEDAVPRWPSEGARLARSLEQRVLEQRVLEQVKQ